MDSSKSLEISVDLGNLPHLLNDLAQSVRSIQEQVDQINHAIQTNSNKHETLVLKQSILISEVQSSETNLGEISDTVRLIKNRIGLLEVHSKALTDSELQSSIRIDGVASTTKSLEKVVLDISSEMKTHSLKMSEMLTAASNSESNWTCASDKIESALCQVEAVSNRSTLLHEQTQIMLEDSYSRSSSLNRKIELELKSVDAKCHESMGQIRMEINRLNLNTTSDDIAKVSRMYQRIIGDMRATRIRETLGISTLVAWRSETLNGLKRNATLRNVVRMLSRKFSPVFVAFNTHRFHMSLHIKFNESVKGFMKLHESVDTRLISLKDENATVRDILEEFRSGLSACCESVGAIRDRPIEDQSSKITEMMREGFTDIDRRVTDQIESEIQKYLSSTVQEIQPNDSSDKYQVQEMLKDLLILWESIKDVDTKKVDKLFFEEQNGVLASQIANIKADVLSLRNLVESQRMQSPSASTIATLMHHPSDTLITRDSGLGGGRQEVNGLYELSKSSLYGKHSRSEGFTKIRPTSAKKSSLTDQIRSRKQDLHIVAQKIH